jgi:hypothetical protein
VQGQWIGLGNPEPRAAQAATTQAQICDHDIFRGALADAAGAVNCD